MATILIVEDRPIDRKLLLTVLRSGGYQVVEASDGEEALHLTRTHHPDLVISDILMPTVDGYEFVRRLRSTTEIADTPVLFYTATYHEREARALAEQCGVVDILTKPSRPEIILDTVNHVVAERPRPAYSPHLPQFDREHLQIVSSALAAKVSEVEAGQQRIAAIVDIAQQIAEEHDPEALLQRVCGAAREVTFAQQAMVFLLDEQGSAVRRVLSRGFDRETSTTIRPPSVDTPIVRRLIKDRRPVRAENPDGRPEVLGLPQNQPPIHSLLGVPIASSTRVYGWLALSNKLGADAFTDADEEFAATLGTHAAVAYENAELYEHLRRHVAALEQEVADRRRAEQAVRHRSRLATFTSAIGSALTSSRTVAEMLDGCAQASVQHLEAVLTRIWIFDARDSILEMRATAGASAPNGDQSLLRLDDPLIGRIARERHASVVNSVDNEPAVFDLAWAKREKAVSFAGYPLMVDDRLVGVIGLFSRSPLSRETIDVLESVSRQIALGIERRQVEERLRENEERTRFALGAARMGVWELHLASDRMTWSETLAPVFGLTPESSPTDSSGYLALIHPDDRATVVDALQRAIREGDEYSVEFRVVWADGSVHWIDGRARVLFDAFGRPDRVLGVAIDVSERKLLEQQFRQAQKMEGIGQLAGGVAHDFNNLITAILGYAALLTDSLDPHDPRRVELGEIVKATERASGLTRQLLAFSRRQVLEPTVLSLNALITDLTQMLGRLIGEDVDLVTSLASDLVPVRADAGQLEQVILNLAVNARDAMPTGGRLVIETANVDLGEEYVIQHVVPQPGRYVMLAMSDTGTGMDEETRTRLFEPFFTTKEKGKGTGLGLATVYGIVKQSGGYIFVYSEPGRGATFKVYLPRVEGESLTPRPTTSDTDPPAGGTETILLVEDEEAVRLLARIVLQRAGYHLLDAENPDHAVSVFREHADSIDLLLTDVVMPGSGGPALYEKLTALQPDLRVVYMSGYTDDAVVRHGRLDPGIAFLQKPFTGDKLLRKVREVLDR